MCILIYCVLDVECLIYMSKTGQIYEYIIMGRKIGIIGLSYYRIRGLFGGDFNLAVWRILLVCQI